MATYCDIALRCSTFNINDPRPLPVTFRGMQVVCDKGVTPLSEWVQLGYQESGEMINAQPVMVMCRDCYATCFQRAPLPAAHKAGPHGRLVTQAIAEQEYASASEAYQPDWEALVPRPPRVSAAPAPAPLPAPVPPPAAAKPQLQRMGARFFPPRKP